MHGDARPRPEAIETLLATVAPPGRKVGCAGARIVSLGGELEPSSGFRPTRRGRVGAAALRRAPRLARPFVRRPAAFAPTARCDVDWVSEVTLLARREAFDAVGGMDDGYFLAFLACDFGLRLREAGWRVVHEVRASTIHYDIVVESKESVRRARRRFAAAHGARHRRRSAKQV